MEETSPADCLYLDDLYVEQRFKSGPHMIDRCR